VNDVGKVNLKRTGHCFYPLGDQVNVNKVTAIPSSWLGA